MGDFWRTCRESEVLPWSFEKDFWAEHPRNMKQWVGSLKYSAEKGISRYVYQSSISFIDIWILIDLFGVDNEGHQFVCWYVRLYLCRFVHLLIWYASVVVMKCLRIMRVVAFDTVLPTCSEDSWMIHEVDFLRFSFICSSSFTLCFFYFPCFLISVNGTHPFSHPCSKEILENLE